MWDWIKGLFSSPKALLRLAVNSMDELEAPLAAEIDKVKAKFNAMTSFEQAQWLVNQVQAFLRKKLKLDA